MGDTWHLLAGCLYSFVVLTPYVRLHWLDLNLMNFLHKIHGVVGSTILIWLMLMKTMLPFILRFYNAMSDLKRQSRTLCLFSITNY